MQFEIRGLRGSERVTTLSVDAVDARDAEVQAGRLGYSVITVRPRRSGWSWPSTGGTAFPLVQFSHELCSLLRAGLPLVEALETLADNDHRPQVRRVLAGVVERLVEGRTLSHALERYPTSFPTLYVATVRASERTGNLPEALTRYVGYEQRMEQVRRQVVGALVYPVLLLIVGSLVIVFLMAYVVPRFSRIYAEMDSELPLLSRALMRWGTMLEAHGTLALTAVAGLIAVMSFGVTRPSSRERVLQILRRVPAVGSRIRTYQLARFYWALSMLLRSGTPAVVAMESVVGLLPSTLGVPLRQAILDIRQGRSISQAMDDRKLTTPIASRMLRVGEHTGQMGEMMDCIASFYDDETARWVERFTKLFEPLLMVFIGLVIGTVVVLMYFPIFELAGSIQ